jgi:hypothetical protein
MLEKLAQSAAQRLRDPDILKSLDHVLHPCRPLLLANREAKMRFPEAQPPPALRIVAGAAEELNQEGSELLDGAMERLSGKKWTEQRIPIHTGIEGLGESAPSRRAAHSLMQVVILIHTTNSLSPVVFVT